MRVKKICPLIRASDLMTGRVRDSVFVLILPQPPHVADVIP